MTWYRLFVHAQAHVRVRRSVLWVAMEVFYIEGMRERLGLAPTYGER